MRFDTLNTVRKIQNKSILILIVILTQFIITCKKNTNDPENTYIAISGKITLEGETNHSNIEVMLFKSIQIDTEISNIRQDFINVGIPVNQKTEFYWREEEPIRTTITDKNGNWSFEDVEKDEYHVVARNAGYGWKVLYNIKLNENNILLNKQIPLNGIITQNLDIPENSFVFVEGNTTFEQNITLSIGSGTIIEFAKNSSLSINGSFNVNGQLDREIYFVSQAKDNNNRISVSLSQSINIKYLCSFDVQKGIYISSSQNINIEQCRFKNQNLSVELFNSQNIQFKNNLITNMKNGVVEQNSQQNFEKNLVIYITDNGLDSKSSRNSLVKNNIFKLCNKSAIGLNVDGANYPYTFITVFENNFENNNFHIQTGFIDSCRVNNNNFLDSDSVAVFCSQIYPIVFYNFRYNYWNSTNTLLIDDRIIDLNDYNTGTLYQGPYVDFTDFSQDPIRW